MPDIKAIADRIKKRLEVVGLAASKAGQEAGVGLYAIRDIYRGASDDPKYERYRSVSLRTLAVLAPVLNTTPGWLFDATGPEENAGNSKLTVPVGGSGLVQEPKEPCAVVELPEAFRVEDADGRAVSYVYYATGARLSAILGSWMKDEARAIAQRIARGSSQ